MKPEFDSIRSSHSSWDLQAVARDCWPGGTLAFWQGERPLLPAKIMWPQTEAEVLSVLQGCASTKTPVIAYGAGSGVCGGARGLPGAVVLDLKAFNRISNLDEEQWTVEVGAGVIGQHLEDWLAKRGFTVGHSPSSIACSTVGGWAAARGAGQFSSKYGVFEDMVLSMRLVSLAHGAITIGEGGDPKHDLTDVVLGSEGRLGVITHLKLRVWPLPKKRVLRGYNMPSVASAISAMRALMQGELWPSVVRLYDPVDTRIGGKTKPKKEKQSNESFLKDWLKSVDELPRVHRHSLSLPLALPGFINHVFDRIASGCLLIVGFEGDEEVVDVTSEAGFKILDRFGENLGSAPGERWYDSRHAVSYKLMPIFERGGFADTMEVACRWSTLEDTYQAVRASLGESAVVMAHMSHAYPEGASIYFSFAGRGDQKVYERTWSAGLAAVLDSGATVTHHHGVGFLKSEMATRELGKAHVAWRDLQSDFESSEIMNPGRLFLDEEMPSETVPASLHDVDGLARVSCSEPLSTSFEALWPWESMPALPRWQRLPWQTGWMEVSGRVDDGACVLGRAPRSAAGPDLRGWLFKTDPEASCTVPVSTTNERWMGVGEPDRPWEVAQSLLRSDLRPARLNVIDGKLYVGFRGPAAVDLGRVAIDRVPGGLRKVDYEAASLPSGALQPCSVDDPGVVHVTISGAWRRGES